MAPEDVDDPELEPELEPEAAPDDPVPPEVLEDVEASPSEAGSDKPPSSKASEQATPAVANVDAAAMRRDWRKSSERE